MNLTDYAVYKDNNEPWTIEEVKLIAQSMGDFSSIEALYGNALYEYMYQDSDNEVHPWSAQNIHGKTTIKYSDYIKLIKPNYNNHSLKTVVAKELNIATKQEKPMANRTGKYLSLKINDGVANTRSLIFQAHATGINETQDRSLKN